LQPVLDLGLGYLTLGQASNSFSGGEAQRLKLLSLLKETSSALKSMLLIFDEPTTGLSDKDVLNLWKHLDFLTQKGHTIIVIEHHLDMIRHADWLIEIGPDAADLGGQVVYQGAPSGIFLMPLSKTAPFLKS
jgi:excinuclease ABC subunit A